MNNGADNNFSSGWPSFPFRPFDCPGLGVCVTRSACHWSPAQAQRRGKKAQVARENGHRLPEQVADSARGSDQKLYEMENKIQNYYTHIVVAIWHLGQTRGQGGLDICIENYYKLEKSRRVTVATTWRTGSWTVQTTCTVQGTNVGSVWSEVGG